MPVRESVVVRLETGHNPQPSAGTQHPVETSELLGRPVEVFDDLRADDKIIALFKRFRIGIKNRVEQPRPVSRLAQHAGKGRPRTASIVQSFGLRRQPMQQRIGELR